MKYIVFLFIPLFFSCSSQLEVSKDKVDAVEYHFQDASIPPEYHRSYSIKVTADKLNVVVDSYGDILAEKEVALAAGLFDKLIETINNAKLVETDFGVNVPCDGSTTENLQIFENGKKVYDTYVDHCGGDLPEKYGDFDKVVDLMESYVPEFVELLQ